jgi:hypothetical protein
MFGGGVTDAEEAIATAAPMSPDVRSTAKAAGYLREPLIQVPFLGATSGAQLWRNRNPVRRSALGLYLRKAAAKFTSTIAIHATTATHPW